LHLALHAEKQLATLVHTSKPEQIYKTAHKKTTREENVLRKNGITTPTNNKENLSSKTY